MRYQHSYWYLNAKEVFEEALKADPTCAMAQWGIALTLMDNPHNAIPRPNRAPASPPSRRPRRWAPRPSASADYIDALIADVRRLRQAQPHAAHARVARRAGKGRGKYPDDDEAQIAYAITLNTSADLNDKTYAQQTKGAAILEPISKAAAAASGRHALPDPSL